MILLELYPEALTRKGYVGGTAAILNTLHDAGYADVLHSGFADLLNLTLLYSLTSLTADVGN